MFFLRIQTKINPFQPSVAFHVETSHLIRNANQTTGFYMKCNNGLKRAKESTFKIQHLPILFRFWYVLTKLLSLSTPCSIELSVRSVIVLEQVLNLNFIYFLLHLSLSLVKSARKIALNKNRPQYKDSI